jgi:DNA-binding MarR family transcriptional regulator
MPTSPAPERAVPADLQRDAEGLQLALAELVRVYQFRDRDRICCHDISVTQCYALETLVDHGPLRLGGLADRLFLDKSTTSRVVATLVKKGYVQQRPDATDARAVAISATARGGRLCARINADLVDQQRQLLEDLEPSSKWSAAWLVPPMLVFVLASRWGPPRVARRRAARRSPSRLFSANRCYYQS